MIESQEALKLVWQQQAPPDWQIWQGKRDSPMTAGLGTFVGTLGALGFCVCCASGITEIVARPAFTKHPLWLLVVGGAVLGSALIVGSVVGLRFAHRRNDPNPVLILRPEGVIEYVSQDKPTIGIPFAEVAELSITSSATTTSATSILGRLSTTSNLNSVHAQIVYRDGHQDSWQPRSTFETAATFPQAMMDAYRKTLDTE
jgi:hypothetical protein